MSGGPFRLVQDDILTITLPRRRENMRKVEGAGVLFSPSSDHLTLWGKLSHAAKRDSRGDDG
jgi:hypothetical protein